MDTGVRLKGLCSRGWGGGGLGGVKRLRVKEFKGVQSRVRWVGVRV